MNSNMACPGLNFSNHYCSQKQDHKSDNVRELFTNTFWKFIITWIRTTQSSVISFQTQKPLIDSVMICEWCPTGLMIAALIENHDKNGSFFLVNNIIIIDYWPNFRIEVDTLHVLFVEITGLVLWMLSLMDPNSSQIPTGRIWWGPKRVLGWHNLYPSLPQSVISLMK